MAHVNLLSLKISPQTGTDFYPKDKWPLAYSTTPGPEESQISACLTSGTGIPDIMLRVLSLCFYPW